MSDMKKLEERVTALEREIEELKAQRTPPRQGKPGWLNRMIGSMNDCPDFDEIVRLGAEWRKSQTYENEPETAAIRAAERAKAARRKKKSAQAKLRETSR